MNKKPYTQVEIEVVLFPRVDAIVASGLVGPGGDKDDTNIVH